MPPAEYAHELDLFGTDVRLLVGRDGQPLYTRTLVGRVQERLRAIHRALTRFDSDSELNHLNAHAGEAIRVSDTLLDAVRAALWASEFSGGLLDPTILPDLERAGYVTSRVGQTPAPLGDALAQAPPRGAAIPQAQADWRRIHVNPRQGIVRLPPGVRIDLGGSAKGLAADIAARMLAGSASFAVDAGGDIQIGGTRAGSRTVQIAHPLDEARNHRIELATGAIATSGPRTRVWRTPEGYAHHLIDPGRRRPAWTGVIQATALAPSALEAETRAKIALLRGPLAGRGVLQRYGGAMVPDSGKMILAGELDTPIIDGFIDPASA
jgi:FAD:protein FMN transferase